MLEDQGILTLLTLLGTIAAAAAHALLSGLALTRGRAGLPVAVAALATLGWAIAAASGIAAEPMAAAVTLAWAVPTLAPVWSLPRAAGHALRPMVVALAALAVLALAIATLRHQGLADPVAAQPALDAIGLLLPIGALILLQGTYAAADAGGRAMSMWTLGGLAAWWTVKFNLVACALLLPDAGALFAALDPGFTALLAAPLALGLIRARGAAVVPSRAIQLSSLALVLAAGYLVVLALLSWVVSLLGGVAGDRAGGATAALGLATAGLLLAPRARRRRWRAAMARHLFAHRYDYRQEWQAFSERLAAGDGPLPDRAAHALAALVGAEAALIFQCQGDGLVPAGAWQWDGATGALDAGVTARLAAGDALLPDDPARLPHWLAAGGLWVLHPLATADGLAGAIALRPPRPARAIDHEDAELLRIAARQAATALAEARAQTRLAEAARFEEFNRRFAFMLHDIKNMVSRLGVLAANARRHGDNPDFRADMIRTLEESAQHMGQLSARLSLGEAQPSRPAQLDVVAVGPLLVDLVARASLRHPVIVRGDPVPAVRADRALLNAALSHIVDNAIDAASGTLPVLIDVDSDADAVRITVRDDGAGMSERFIAEELFRPFASTKPGGFGIGAYQARAILRDMGGDITVFSREGAGTAVTLTMPPAPQLRVAA